MYETTLTCDTCGAAVGDIAEPPQAGLPVVCGACYVAEATSAQQRRAMEAKASTERQRFPIPEFLRKGQA